MLCENPFITLSITPTAGLCVNEFHRSAQECRLVGEYSSFLPYLRFVWKEHDAELANYRSEAFILVGDVERVGLSIGNARK